MGGLKTKGQHFNDHTHIQKGILTGHTYVYVQYLWYVKCLANIPCSQTHIKNLESSETALTICVKGMEKAKSQHEQYN